MRIAVSTTGNGLDSPFSPTFGRCPFYLIVDTDTMVFWAEPNSAADAAHGAGIQAAESVAGLGVNGIVTGNVGPNAYQVLASAGVPVYVFSGRTVRQAVEAYKSGQLSPVAGPTGPAHGGMGRGPGGRGMGGRGARGRGMGGWGGR
jgi:predicted Fe-Mo cluster-binding NifX family protein